MATKAEELNDKTLTLVAPLTEVHEAQFEQPEPNFRDKTVIIHSEARFGKTGRVGFDVEGYMDDIYSGVPIAIIIGGFGGTAESYRLQRTEFAKRHQPTATINDHELLFYRDKPFTQLLDPQKLAVDAGLAVASNISSNLGRRKSRLLSHSAGGPASTRMILEEPGLFESDVLMGSAGITAHNLFTLAPRAGNFLLKDLALSAYRLRVPFSARLLAQHAIFAANPRTLLLGLAVAQTDILDDLAKIKQIDGVHTALVQFHRDSFFDASTARKHAEDLVDEVFDYPDKRANHAWTHMMQGQVAHHLSQLFDRLSLLEAA